MIPIWIAVVIAGVAFWVGFIVCAGLAVGRDKPINYTQFRGVDRRKVKDE